MWRFLHVVHPSRDLRCFWRGFFDPSTCIVVLDLGCNSIRGSDLRQDQRGKKKMIASIESHSEGDAMKKYGWIRKQDAWGKIHIWTFPLWLFYAYFDLNRTSFFSRVPLGPVRETLRVFAISLAVLFGNGSSSSPSNMHRPEVETTGSKFALPLFFSSVWACCTTEHMLTFKILQ